MSAERRQEGRGIAARWPRAFKITLSMVLLGTVLNHAGLEPVLQEIKQISAATLLVATAIAVSGVLLIVAKWGAILHAQGVAISFQFLLRVYFVSWFFSQFTLGGAGGFVYRTWALSRQTGSAGVAGASLIVDRIADLAGLGLLALMGIGVTISLLGAQWVVVGAVVFAVGLGLAGYLFLWGGSAHLLNLPRFLPVVWREQGERAVKEFVSSLQQMGGAGPLWARVLVLSVAFHLLSVLFHYSISMQQGWEIHWKYFLAIVPLIGVVSLLPLTINGIGLSQWLYVVMFQGAGLAPQKALLLSVLILAFTMVWGLVGGLIYALTAEPAAASSGRDVTRSGQTVPKTDAAN